MVDINKTNIFTKFKYALSILTIEPMMVIQGIASNIVRVPEDQMVLYKICRGSCIQIQIHSKLHWQSSRGTIWFVRRLLCKYWKPQKHNPLWQCGKWGRLDIVGFRKKQDDLYDCMNCLILTSWKDFFT